MRFTVQDNQLTYGNKVLGPADALYANPTELTKLTEADGVIHMTLPKNIDLVFVAGAAKVIVCESKRTSDLWTSIRCKRLARQLTAAIELGDAAALVWRGQEPAIPDEILRELVKLQVCGVYVLMTGRSDKEVLTALGAYKEILNPESRAAFSALRGTDQKQPVKGTFLSVVPGFGPQRVRRLLRKFGSARNVFNASVKDIVAEGVPKGMVERMNVLLDANPLEDNNA